MGVQFSYYLEQEMEKKTSQASLATNAGDMNLGNYRQLTVPVRGGCWPGTQKYQGNTLEEQDRKTERVIAAAGEPCYSYGLGMSPFLVVF